MLLAVSQAMKLSSDIIPRIASGFGGGIGKQGEVCGAVTGGVMAIGLVSGRDLPDDKQGKERAYQKAAEYMQQFQAQNHAIRCGDLLGVTLDESGLEVYRANNMKGEVCIPAVSRAVRLVLEICQDQMQGSAT